MSDLEKEALKKHLIDYQGWLDELRQELDEHKELLKEFLDHYESRKITNGFHDLLAKKIKKLMEKQ